MTWGGLRGAVSLALALTLMTKSSSSQSHRSSDLDLFTKASDEIIIVTTIIVAMTLFLNATTVKSLLERLGMLDISNSKHMTMKVAISNLTDNRDRTIGVYRYDPFLSDSYWPMVIEKTDLMYPYKKPPSDEVLLQGVVRKGKKLVAVLLS